MAATQRQAVLAQGKLIAATDRRGWLLAIVLGAAASIAAPRAVHAQNADAEALFTEAEGLETAGKIAEACDAFEGSNRIEPRAGTLIRLGQCREKQGLAVSAWSAYKDALTRVKDPAKRQIAAARVAALEPTLSYLTVSVSDEARIDGLAIMRNGKPLDQALWNRAAPVDGGVFTVSGQAPGHEAWSTTIEIAATGDKASVEVPRFKAIVALVEKPADVGLHDVVKDPIDRPTHATGMFTPRRKIAVGVGAVGLAAVAVGVVFGVQAKGLESDALVQCPNPAQACANAAAAQDLSDRANSRALLANISYGVGGAAMIGAAVLWFTGAAHAASDDDVAVAPRLRSGFSGIDVTVRF
jgi:tetratricopeptide (TPR) repeat protein